MELPEYEKLNDNAQNDPRLYAIPDIHGHAKGEHKAFIDERPIPLSARMLFLWFYHACRRGWPRFLMVTDHMNYLTFEDPAAINLVRRALKLAQAGDLYGAAETASVEVGHAAVVSEGLRRGMRYSIGAEVDNDPRCRPDAQNIVDAMKPDGMIRSVHFLTIDHPTHGPAWNWPFDNPEFSDVYEVVGTAKTWELYMATLLDAIERLPGNIVGHFYVPALFGHWPDDATLEQYENQLVDACEARGMAIEFNTRFLYREHSAEERAKYLAAHRRLLAKCKAKNVGIAVGSDAHSPKDQGGAFDTVLAVLDECEINELVFPLGGRLARVALRVERKAEPVAEPVPAAVEERKAARKARPAETAAAEVTLAGPAEIGEPAEVAKPKTRPRRSRSKTAESAGAFAPGGADANGSKVNGADALESGGLVNRLDEGHGLLQEPTPAGPAEYEPTLSAAFESAAAATTHPAEPSGRDAIVSTPTQAEPNGLTTRRSETADVEAGTASISDAGEIELHAVELSAVETDALESSAEDGAAVQGVRDGKALERTIQTGSAADEPPDSGPLAPGEGERAGTPQFAASGAAASADDIGEPELVAPKTPKPRKAAVRRRAAAEQSASMAADAAPREAAHGTPMDAEAVVVSEGAPDLVSEPLAAIVTEAELAPLVEMPVAEQNGNEDDAEIPVDEGVEPALPAAAPEALPLTVRRSDAVIRPRTTRPRTKSGGAKAKAPAARGKATAKPKPATKKAAKPGARPAAKKAAVKKSAAKKTGAAKSGPAKTAAAKAVKKSPEKKAPSKKAAAQKAPAKKAAVRTAGAKKSAAKRTAKKAPKKPAQRRR